MKEETLTVPSSIGNISHFMVSFPSSSPVEHISILTSIWELEQDVKMSSKEMKNIEILLYIIAVIYEKTKITSNIRDY